MRRSKSPISADDNSVPGLARECAKLDPEFEKALADEGLDADLRGWPEY
jgi:hypothetical protein